MPPRKTTKPAISGARESNAGDDFHILWAARRALSLLDPRSSLKALSIEGPDPKEAESVDPNGGALLGIDLAEYHGGALFEDAHAVHFCQLKYSTRHPNREWTASRLSERKRGKKSRSIIARFADAFRAYRDRYGADLVRCGLQMKLISNQPVSSRLRSAIREAQQCIATAPTCNDIAALLPQLTEESRAEVQCLHNGSGTDARDFIDLIRVLNLDDCGAGSRSLHEAKLAAALDGFDLSESSRGDRSKLKEAIRERMMPAASGGPPLDLEALLPVFGIDSFDELFPAPPKLDRGRRIVDRPVSKELAAKLLETTLPVVLHATGGVGKTTVITELDRWLPQGSVHLIYDCYGRGDYLNPADVRHPAGRALVQLLNELALTGRTRFLLNPPSAVEDLVRVFITRLEAAAKTTRGVTPDARIVISIDAADNSINAAKDKRQHSFVFDLLGQPLPEGVILLVSCRTENLGLLPTDFSYEPFQLLPFAEEDSATHLNLYLRTAATQVQAREFHRLTNGVPRIQKYLLERNFDGFDDLLKPVRPDGKKLDQLFDTWLGEAALRGGLGSQGNTLSGVLIRLPRPIPVSISAAIMDVSEDTVRSFCHDAGGGFLANGDEIHFRDQDFEDYLRRKYGTRAPSIDAMIGDKLLDLQVSHRYAARHVHEFLERAGRSAELFDLVLEHGGNVPALDSVEASRVFLDRAASALRVADPREHMATIFKILLLAAEGRKQEGAVRELITSRPDLAMRYNDPENVRNLCNQGEIGGAWPAPTHWSKARVLSLFPETREQAIKHLMQARGWVDWWSRQRKSSADEPPPLDRIEDVDLANAAEAILRLYGPREARQWLAGWRPKDLSYRVVPIVVTSIFGTDGIAGLKDLLAKRHWRADILLSMVAEAERQGVHVERERLAKLGRTWIRLLRQSRFPVQLTESALVLCEQLARNPATVDLAAELLPRLPFSRPKHGSVSRFGGRAEWELHLRQLVLREAFGGKETAIEDMLPTIPRKNSVRAKGNGKERIEQARKEIAATYESLIPHFRLRAKALIHGSGAAVSLDDVKRIKKVFEDYDNRNRHDSQDLQGLALGAVSDAIVLSGTSSRDTIDLLHHVLRDRNYGPRIPNLLLVADRLSRAHCLHNEVLSFLADVASMLKGGGFTGSESMGYFAECTAICRRFHDKAAQKYFDMAIEAASGVDRDAPLQIVATLSIARPASSALAGNPLVPELCHTIGRFAEQCYEAVGYDKHWPWDSIFEGICALHPPSLLAMVSRWDDRGFCSLERYFSEVLVTLAKSGHLPPSAAVALSVIDYPHRHLSSLLSRLMETEQQKAPSALAVVERDIRVHMDPEDRSRVASKVVQWAEGTRWREAEPVRHLQKVVEFYSTDRKPRGTSSTTAELASAVREEANWRETLKRLGPFDGAITPVALRELLEQLRSASPRQHVDTTDVIRELAGGLGVTSRISLLEAIVMFEKGGLKVHLDELSALEGCKRLWETDPSVEGWFNERRNAQDFLRRKFDGFGRIEYFSNERWGRFLSLFCLEAHRALEMALPEIASRVVRATADWSYGVVAATASALSPPIAKEVLLWAVKRFETLLKPDFGDGPWKAAMAPPGSSEVELSHFLWKLLGHPDKRIRWRAAHVVRRLVKLGYNGIPESLCRCWDMQHLPAYCDRGQQFFWLSARTWLLLTIRRIASEKPDALYPIAPFLFAQATGANPPHALQRHYAKHACLQLASVNPALFSDVQLDALRGANMSPYPRLKRSHILPEIDPSLAGLSCHYQFDALDTLRYWYSRLTDVFPVPLQEVEIRANRWICDAWGFINSDKYKYRGRGRQNDDWELTRNDHGAEPMIETLQTYLEWHAMMCVGSELLAVRPVHASFYEDGERDEFDDWLRRWGPHFEDRWLADLLCPSPLEPLLHEPGDPADENWARFIPYDHFDRYLSSGEAEHPGFILVAGEIDKRDHSHSEQARIASALVSETTAHSLMCALQTCANASLFALPGADDGHHAIDHYPFRLQGWLVDHESNLGYTDDHDPLRRSLSPRFKAFGREFCDYAQATYDEGHSVLRDPTGRRIGVREVWNDVPNQRRGPDSFVSEGKRLWVDRETLLGFLGRQRCCLIIECSIHRWQMRSESEYVPDKAKIYLICGDGRRECLPEDALAGQKNCGGSGGGG